MERLTRLPGTELVVVSEGWRVPGLSAAGRLAFDPATSEVVVVEFVDDAADFTEAELRVAGVVAEFTSRRSEIARSLEPTLIGAVNDDGRLLDGWSAPLGSIRGEVWWPGGKLVVPKPAPPVGPQNDADSTFVARLRLAQSRWRSEVLGVPAGLGPQRAAGRELGSMLTPTDAAMGRNFLTRSAWEVAQARIESGPGVEPFRCRANLLSSQPMSFNLFGPLVGHLGVARQLLCPLLPGDVEEVTLIRIEYAPSPAEEYLDDLTSFDVFIEYVDGDGERAFVGVETKLTEPFSPKAYDSDRYRELTDAPGSPWVSSKSALADPAWNQLWRDHLLVEATRTHRDVPHGRRGSLAVVHHPDDPSIGSAIAGYRRFLRYPEAVLVWPLDRLLATMRSEAEDFRVADWLDRFAARYL